jgi:phage tail sheath protein FI
MSSTSFFHGVTVSSVDTGTRTISIPSSSIIGLVDTVPAGWAALATPGAALPNVATMLTSKAEAVAAFGADSDITKSALAIYDITQAVIIAVAVEAAADAALTSAVIGGVKADGSRTGLQALLDGKSLFNAQPRLLIAPGHSRKLPVATAMDQLAAKLQGLGIIDGPGTTDEAAFDYAENFGSKWLYMVDPGVKYWSTTANADVDAPGSARAAAMFAWTDATYGFWASPSNKIITGITGTGRPIEYLDGDPTCRANLLNNANIATIIRDDGFRLWGNRTLSSDSKWSFVTRVRTQAMVMAAILYGHKWAVDRSITKTYIRDVTDGLNDFMRDLKAQGAVINFEVYVDKDKTTASMLSQGKAFWRIRFTDVPPAENPNFDVEVTDDWITEVLDTRS